jgi:hypothetical protein
MKRYPVLILSYLFFITASPAFSQADSSFVFIKTIPGNYKTFAVDNLDNLYLFTAGGQLKKLDNRGDSTGVFNDLKRYGVPSGIDVSNPLKVLLYYKKYTTILILDRYLSLRNTINLRKKNIYYVNAIAASYDNNIWLFDEQECKLKKTDEDANTLLETPDLRRILDSVPAPQKIINKENVVYLYDPARGFYLFDNYGAYKNHLPFYNWKNIEANNNMVYGFSGNTLFSYQLQSLMLKEYLLPGMFSTALSVRAINGKVYLLTKEGISIYQIK